MQLDLNSWKSFLLSWDTKWHDYAPLHHPPILQPPTIQLVTRYMWKAARKVSRCCLESGGCLDVSGVWKVFRGVRKYLKSTRKVSGSCLDFFWHISGSCKEGGWKVSGICLKGVRKMTERFQEGFWMFKKCLKRGLEGVWKVSWSDLRVLWKGSERQTGK